jgi:hypothetical protein
MTTAKLSGLREPINARGHRVVAHLCAEFEQLLLRLGCTGACAREIVERMIRRAQLAAAKDAQNLDAGERDTATLFERVLAQ